uniref:hypothetical protein n=1 Tax=Bartonella rattaustraliani TaxID=481139 RepID=UPI000378819D
MAGKIILNVLPEYAKIKNSILFDPAFYSIDAFNLPFNSEFSDAIRKTKSWEHNNSAIQLQKFYGDILLFKSDNDSLIPQGVFDCYKKHANNCLEVIIKNSPHTLGSWFSEDIRRFEH